MDQGSVYSTYGSTFFKATLNFHLQAEDMRLVLGIRELQTCSW
jgi:hypothetical protein